jgi:hypothetical protein
VHGWTGSVLNQLTHARCVLLIKDGQRPRHGGQVLWLEAAQLGTPPSLTVKSIIITTSRRKNSSGCCSTIRDANDEC